MQELPQRFKPQTMPSIRNNLENSLPWNENKQNKEIKESWRRRFSCCYRKPQSDNNKENKMQSMSICETIHGGWWWYLKWRKWSVDRIRKPSIVMDNVGQPTARMQKVLLLLWPKPIFISFRFGGQFLVLGLSGSQLAI